MRLLDLFCGAGGAAVGYNRAGFTEIVGVDINPQPNYPFEFIQTDAMEVPLDGDFDAIHASPPCQAYSWAAKRWEVPRQDLVDSTRERLRSSGLPWVMENVIGSPVAKSLVLCGTYFGLEVLRHRLFESNLLLLAPGTPCKHKGSVRDGTYVTVAGHGGDNIKGRGSRAAKQEAMGINWMSDEELNEAIPPAYTEFIGKQLIQQLQQVPA